MGLDDTPHPKLARAASFGMMQLKEALMAAVTVQIPDDLLARLTCEGCEPGKALREAAAFSLCSRGKLSTSQAAKLAGLTYADFLDAAARAKVELFPIDSEELKEEIRVGYTLGRECVAGDPASASRTT
jgi:predicted HTH domain antitoxin